MHSSRLWLLLFLIVVSAGTLPGQVPGDNGSAAGAAGFSAPPTVPPLARWLELQAGTVAARYKRTAVSSSPWTYQFQYQVAARGRLKFDRLGHYHAGFRFGTGDSFTHSWNSTGIGAGELVSKVYLKELYLSASPWRALEIQFGGIGFNRGESTEVTSYSNNGYLMGERISLHRPDKLYFDEISATGAYVGDPEAPGVYGRFKRLSRMNYHQFLVSKRVGKYTSVSADYTAHDGVDTLRQAVRVKPPSNRFLDSAVFDNYYRMEFRPAWGCSVSVYRNPLPRLALYGGFVHVDRYYLNWNSDRLGRGNRFYLVASYNFWREFSANFFAGKAFSNDFPVSNAARFDFVLSYDFLRALKRHEIL